MLFCVIFFFSGVLMFAEIYRCEKLQKQSLQIIKQRFPLVCQATEFVQLSAKRVEEIVSFPDLNLGMHLYVIQCCVK